MLEEYRITKRALFLDKLAMGKAISLDGLSDHVCRKRDFMVEVLYPKLRNWVRDPCISDIDNTGRMMLIAKNGNGVSSLDDSRPITILSPFRKCCELMWLSHMEKKIWAMIGEY
jgi:hypothetical protein